MEVKREVVARSALLEGERGASWLKNDGGPESLCGQGQDQVPGWRRRGLVVPGTAEC